MAAASSTPSRARPPLALSGVWARSGWPPGPAYGFPMFSIAPGYPPGPRRDAGRSGHHGGTPTIPVEKALARDTLLVYGMNGDVLPPDHGFPLVCWPAAGSGWRPRSGSARSRSPRLRSNRRGHHEPGCRPQLPGCTLADGQVVKSALEASVPGHTPSRRGRDCDGRWSGEREQVTRVTVAFDDHGPWRPAQLDRTDVSRPGDSGRFPGTHVPGGTPSGSARTTTGATCGRRRSRSTSRASCSERSWLTR